VLVLLDERTWTSGADTGKFVEHVHEAMRTGLHIVGVHELPSLVGPPRHACDFGRMFDDGWTPAHLTGGLTNLYKDLNLGFKGEEWRQPGLVALAAKLASSAGEHVPIRVRVPATYVPKAGPNPWATLEKVSARPLPAPAATRTRVSMSRRAMSILLPSKAAKLSCHPSFELPEPDEVEPDEVEPDEVEPDEVELASTPTAKTTTIVPIAQLPERSTQLATLNPIAALSHRVVSMLFPSDETEEKDRSTQLHA